MAKLLLQACCFTIDARFFDNADIDNHGDVCMNLINDLLRKMSGNKNSTNNTGSCMESNSIQPKHPEPRFELGEGFYFEFDEVSNGMGGYRKINVYLLKTDDPFFKRCIVDENGIIQNFHGIVDGPWKSSLEFPLDRKTQFRFWIYAYKDGKAPVEWTLQPDGRYFEDEDGFGGENCEEIKLWSHIDTNGFFTEPFKHR